jgi:transposase
MKRKYQAVAPETQRAIVAKYQRGQRGNGIRLIAKDYDLSPGTVQSIIDRAARHDGNPVQPRGHKKTKLSETEEAKLLATADANPFATNSELAASVRNKIAKRTVSTYLLSADPPFTKKVPSPQDPIVETDEWKESMREFVRAIKPVAMKYRVYEDESGIHNPPPPKKARARRGKRVNVTRPYRACKYTLHVWAKQDSVMHWDLRKKNANDDEIVAVADEAVPKLKEGEVVIWDRLGRSGRSLNPMKQHYNPEVIAAIEARGATVRHLPPKGMYLNPVELLFNDLKTNYLSSKMMKLGQNVSFDQVKALIEDYMDNYASTNLSSFFKSRANGHDAMNDGLF